MFDRSVIQTMLISNLLSLFDTWITWMFTKFMKSEFTVCPSSLQLLFLNVRFRPGGISPQHQTIVVSHFGDPKRQFSKVTLTMMEYTSATMLTGQTGQKQDMMTRMR